MNILILVEDTIDYLSLSELQLYRNVYIFIQPTKPNRLKIAFQQFIFLYVFHYASGLTNNRPDKNQPFGSLVNIKLNQWFSFS